MDCPPKEVALAPESLAEFLRTTQLFQGFSSEELASVLPLMAVVQVAPDEVIFEEGDVGNAWYVVRTGAVAVRKRMPRGPEHDLAVLEPGESFGELSLLDDSPRLATVVACTTAELVCLPRHHFRRLVAGGGPAATRLLLTMAEVVCARQRELTHVLADMVDDPGLESDELHNALSVIWRTPAA